MPLHKNPSHNSPIERGTYVSQFHNSNSGLHNISETHQIHHGTVYYQPPYAQIPLQPSISPRILRYGNPKPMQDYSSLSTEGGNRLLHVKHGHRHPYNDLSSERLEGHISPDRGKVYHIMILVYGISQLIIVNNRNS